MLSFMKVTLTYSRNLHFKASVRSFENLNVDVIASACPACKLNIMDGINSLGSKLIILDVVEIVANALGKKR